MKIGVIGIADAWSTEKLLDAVEARTGERHLIEMQNVVLDLAKGRVTHNDLDLNDFDGLIVKKIAKQYSSDALDRLEMLRYLEGCGVRIFSPPASMYPLIDRLSGTVTLQRGGIPMPKTVITESVDQAVAWVNEYGPSVVKPLYTSKARGMSVLEPGPELVDRLANYRKEHAVIYLQQRIEIEQDLGIAFLGGEYLATYARVKQGDSWTTSTSAGGKYRHHEPSPESIEIARKAQGLFDLDFTCVDLAESDQGPLVFEVSAFGGFRGLLDACNVDAAGLYADHAVKVLSK